MDVAQGLQKTGDWRVVYPEGTKSVWMKYNQAKDMTLIYGGKLEYRHENRPE